MSCGIHFVCFYNLFCIFKRIDPIYRVYSPPRSLPNLDFHKEDCSRIHLRREKKEMQVSGQAELEVHLLYWRCFMLLWLCCNSNCVYCWLVFCFFFILLFLRYLCSGTRWKICEGCLGKLGCLFFCFFFFKVGHRFTLTAFPTQDPDFKLSELGKKREK